jgi:hypothetical protein
MKRRDFLYLCSLFLSTKLLANDANTNGWEIIKATLEHMFPKNYFSHNNFSLNFKEFLSTNANLRYISTEDYNFLFKGAKELYQQQKNFIHLPQYKKEKVLRKFETTNFGYNWLNSLQFLVLEAMFSDPIYMGNKNGFAFKIFNHNPGIPQPTKRYVYGI